MEYYRNRVAYYGHVALKVIFAIENISEFHISGIIIVCINYSMFMCESQSVNGF